MCETVSSCGDSTHKKSCVSLVHSQALSSCWDVCSTSYHTVLLPSSHPDRGLARPRSDFQPAACLSFQWKLGCDGDELLIGAKTNLSKYLFKNKTNSNISVNVTLSHLRSTGEIRDLTSNVTPSHLPQGVRYSQKVHPDAEPEKHLQASKYRLGKTAFLAYPSLNQQASPASKS